MDATVKISKSNFAGSYAFVQLCDGFFPEILKWLPLMLQKLLDRVRILSVLRLLVCMQGRQ